jgi:crotonobetaine/carnitine-CoA ligase
MVELEKIHKKPSEFPISTIKELIETKCEENGEKIFAIDGENGKKITYNRVSDKSKEVAGSLHELGIEKGDRVATLLPNSIDHLLIWFGCVRIGAIFSPINPEFKGPELTHTINDIRPRIIVVGGENVDQYNDIRNNIDSVDHEFIYDDQSMGTDPSEIFESKSPPPDVDIRPGDPSTILFSGGTTGKPKPILHSQFAPITGAYRYNMAFDPSESDRHYGVLQLFHIGGQQFGVLGPMISDISTVLSLRFSASSFFEEVNKYDATISDTAGGMLGALLQTHKNTTGKIENSLRITLGMLDYDAHKKAGDLFEVDILEGYALTEGGGILLTRNHFDRDSNISGEGKPIGKINDWAEIGILDEEGGRKDRGEVGEICIRPTIPNSVMSCYYGHPEATLDAWENLWIHTGDIGRIDQNGMLYYVGRQAHWIRRMGENISAYEVEQVLNSHETVAESAVVGVPNEEIGGEDVKAYIIPENLSTNPQELIKWCGENIADFKIPRYIEYTKEFPRSETKNDIQRHSLRDQGIGNAWDRMSDSSE